MQHLWKDLHRTTREHETSAETRLQDEGTLLALRLICEGMDVSAVEANCQGCHFQTAPPTILFLSGFAIPP